MFRFPELKVAAGRMLSALVPVVLLGCSSFNFAPGKALAQTPAAEQQGGQSELSSQLMFELLIAELATHRGQLDVAMSGYLRAAERTDDPRVSERASQLAMFGRQYAEAEKASRRWMALDPEAGEAAQILAQALLHQNKTDEATQLFISIVDASDDAGKVLGTIQGDLLRNGNPNAAVTVLQSLAERYDAEVEAHLGLSRALITQGNPEAALLSASDAVERDPRNTEALMLRAQLISSSGKPDEAYKTLQDALLADPANTRLRLAYAEMLVNGGRYDLAEVELEQIYKDAADNTVFLQRIGLLALESRRLEKAKVYFTDLLASGDYPAESNFYLGRISDIQQEYEQAIEFYDAVTPGDLLFTAQMRAAELTAQTGDLEQGRGRLQELASAAQNPDMQRQLITSESRMLQEANENAEAVRLLSEGLEQFPDDSDLLYARALTAHSAGDETMMIEDLNAIIETEPDNAHALNALGYHYADENSQLELAEELLTKANELLPTDPAIMDSLGWLRFRQGRYDEAIELLRAAHSEFPDPEIVAHLAQALWLGGSEAEAQELITAALEEDPDDEKLLAVKEDLFK